MLAWSAFATWTFATWPCLRILSVTSHLESFSWARYLLNASGPEAEPDLRDGLLFLLHPASIAENLMENQYRVRCTQDYNK